MENGGDYGLSLNAVNSTSGKINSFIYLNSLNPKKSNFSIYVGKTFVVSIPLTNKYTQIIKKTVSAYRQSSLFLGQPLTFQHSNNQ